MSMTGSEFPCDSETHHLGCKCHEARTRARIAALEAELSSAQKLFGQANDQANRYGKLLQEALSELERRNQQLQNAEFCLQRTESERDSFRELAERYRGALRNIYSRFYPLKTTHPNEIAVIETANAFEHAIASHPPEAKGTSDADK